MATRESDINNAPNRFMRTLAYISSQQDRQKREEAQNALIENYGPEAMMPVEQLQLETTRQRQELHPFEVARQGRIQEGSEANVARHGAPYGDPSTANVASERGGAKISALVNVGNALQRELDMDGDPIRALDLAASTPLFADLGVPPEIIDGLREQIRSDPEAAPALAAMLRGLGNQGGTGRVLGNPYMVDLPDGSQVMEYMTDAGPVRRDPASGRLTVVDQGQQRIENAIRNREQQWALNTVGNPQTGERNLYLNNGAVVAVPVPGSAGYFNRQQEALAAIRDARSEIATTRSVIQTAQVNVEEIGRVFDLLEGDWANDPQNAGIFAGGFRAVAERLPDTIQGQIARAITTITNNIALEGLQNVTLTPVSDRDFRALQATLGEMSSATHPTDLRRLLGRALELYSSVVNRETEAIAEREAMLAEHQRQMNQTYLPQGMSFPEPRPTAPGSPNPAPGTTVTTPGVVDEQRIEEIFRELGVPLPPLR